MCCGGCEYIRIVVPVNKCACSGVRVVMYRDQRADGSPKGLQLSQKGSLVNR
jgi:hypothetical protein